MWLRAAVQEKAPCWPAMHSPACCADISWILPMLICLPRSMTAMPLRFPLQRASAGVRS